MSHNDELKKIGLSTAKCVNQILRSWNAATDTAREDGARWYDEGGKIVAEYSRLTGYSPETVAAVIAHLSPRVHWSRNVTGALSVLLTDEASGFMKHCVARALAAKYSDDPLSTINGPKTKAFAANLLGDRDTITVDVWAIRVAAGRFDVEELHAKAGRSPLYEAIANAFRVAAKRAGVDPVTMQATTWIVARNGRAG